jgi:diguanylate cyclase (GGDEF)-like protein
MTPSDLASVLPLFQISSDGIAIAVPGPWRVTFVNANLARWTSRPLSPTDSLAVRDMFRTHPAELLEERLEQVWRGGSSEETVRASAVRRAGNNDVAVIIRLVPLMVGSQRLVGMLVRHTDDAATRTVVERRDPLTGLPDRSALLARLSTLLSGDRTADHRFAVLFIDLDDFKDVNDLYGHLVGDRVLSEAASRLVECTRTSDLVVRYGGDEFVVLVEQVFGDQEIEPIVARIHDALAPPIAVPSGSVHLSVSVGMAEASAAHRTPEDLLAEADQAMYAAKRQAMVRVRK